MLQQTIARLKPLIPAERIWTVTNAEQAAAVRKQVPAAARKRVLIEPMGLNTAVAIGLAAIHVRHAAHGDAFAGAAPRRSLHRTAAKVPGDRERRPRRGSRTWRMVVLGIPSNRAGDGVWVHRKNG